MIWHSTDREQFLINTGADIENGLSEKEVSRLTRTFGYNVLSAHKSRDFITALIKQLKNWPVLLLIISTVIFGTLQMLKIDGSITEPLLILIIVLGYSVWGAFCQYRCDKSVEEIKLLSTPCCKVIRGGKTVVINSAELVPGDVLLVEAGDLIVADARLIETVNLHCNELPLTGQNVPREKDALAVLDEICPISDRVNMLYSGCSVLSGSGLAVVTETGFNTEISKKEQLVIANDTEETTKDKLAHLCNIFSAAVLVVCAITFLLEVLFNLKVTDITFTDMVLDKLMSALALGVAAIPEGLTSVTSVVIALAVKRMTDNHVIVKRIRSVKNISDVSVICSDKTGTLTLNKMTASAVFNGEKSVLLAASGELDSKTANILRLASLCSNVGSDATDPTQLALTDACDKLLNLPKSDLESLYPRLCELPFDADRKLMTTVNMIDGVNYCIVKGAPESLLPLCAECNSEEIMKVNDAMCEKGMRVIAVAVKVLASVPSHPTAEELESSLIFAGLIGLTDKLRKDAASSINLCKKAGIHTVMITGDNILTATAFAQSLGILTPETKAITGNELAAMTDSELYEQVESISVYARVSSYDKLRIVKAWQAHGQTVALTGDAMSESEALRAADVGCAMGVGGSYVARGSADIVLNNNSYSTIVSAIKECRSVFRNLRSAVHYLLACNIGEIIAALLGLLIFGRLPFTALQFLWLNLITDALPVIVLGTDKPGKKIMNGPAQNGRTLFSKVLAEDISWQSIIIAAVTLISYAVGNSFGVGTTAAFITLSLTQILHTLSVRTDGSVFTADYAGNWELLSLIVIGIVFVLITALSTFGEIFGLYIITGTALTVSLLLSLVPTVICEIVKLIRALCLK